MANREVGSMEITMSIQGMIQEGNQDYNIQWIIIIMRLIMYSRTATQDLQMHFLSCHNSHLEIYDQIVHLKGLGNEQRQKSKRPITPPTKS